ncbi:MAG TPA: PAS domain-containing protein [Nitrospira sp.]|nr:PAS domain-containing protein [Nitrospira sp.]
MLERLIRVSLEKKLAVGLGAALILLLGIGIISYRSTADLIVRESRVVQTHEIRETIEQLLLLVEDLESRQLIDLLTGERQYLQSYREKSQSIEAALRTLADQTLESQVQRQHVLTLRRLIDLRVTQFRTLIDLKDAEKIDIDEMKLRLDTGTETMDKIKVVLGKMREQEQMLLAGWSKQTDSAAAFTLSLIFGGTLLTIILASGGGLVIFYDLAKRRQAEKAVTVGHARQALILRSLPIVMYSAKPSGDYGASWVSENSETVTGYPPKSFVDNSSLWASRLHPDDQEKTLMEFSKLSETGTLATEYRWQTHDGEYRWFRDQAVLIRRSDGTPQELVGLLADVTAQRQANELIRRQADIINQIQETVITVDMNGYVTSWNNGAERMLGYTIKEALGKHISFVYPADDREFLEREVLTPVKTKGTHQLEIRRRTKSEALRFAHLSLTLLRNDSGAPIGIVGCSMDITDRKRGEEALLNSRNQLAALAVRLESVREEERGRIALEIHDVLGQALTGLKLDVSWVYKQILESNGSFEPSAVLSRLASSLELVDSTIQSVREIATTLRPGVLDQLGLEAAVEWQAREFRHRTGIACTTSISPDRIDVGEQQSTALFRILQEVLTNVARHAHASEVDIRLEETREQVIMQIRDNGKGITAAEKSGPTAFGLLGMRLRAQQQDGAFDIQGTPGIGTTVTVRMPRSRASDD